MIITLGLIPLMLTLLCLHFSPVLPILGVGLLASVAIMIFDIVRLRCMNIFLFYTSIGMSLLFFFRCWGGERFVPSESVASALELYMAICLFINITLPDFYKSLLQRFRLWMPDYDFECKLIVVLSVIHLIARIVVAVIHGNPFDQIGRLIDIIVPFSIYFIAIIINVIGLRIAADGISNPPGEIRIAPICEGRIYLSLRTVYSSTTKNYDEIWDVPIVYPYHGNMEIGHDLVAKHISSLLEDCGACCEARPILYYNDNEDNTVSEILLYVLPVRDKCSLFIAESGRFFTFDELEFLPISTRLRKEMSKLRTTAQIWKEMGHPGS